jgi:hypothetical protein
MTDDPKHRSPNDYATPDWAGTSASCVVGDYAISLQQWNVSLSHYLDLHAAELAAIAYTDQLWFRANPNRQWRVRRCTPFESDGLLGHCKFAVVEREGRDGAHWPMGVPAFLMPSLADDDAFGANVDTLFKVGMPCKPSKFPMRKNQCSAKVLAEIEVKTIEAGSKDDG